MNAPAEVIERARAQSEPQGQHDSDEDAFEVWPENWQAITIFTRLHAAWHVIGTLQGLHTLGLDPARVKALLDLLGIKRKARPALMDDLQIMEQAALPLLNAARP